jgi:hypothetical protein
MGADAKPLRRRRSGALASTAAPLAAIMHL